MGRNILGRFKHLIGVWDRPYLKDPSNPEIVWFILWYTSLGVSSGLHTMYIKLPTWHLHLDVSNSTHLTANPWFLLPILLIQWSSLYQSMAPLQSSQNNYLKTLLHLLILPCVYFAWNVTLLLHILAWLTPHFLGLCSNITSTARLTLTMVSDVMLPVTPAGYPLSPLPNLFFHEKLVSPHIYLRI